MDGDPWGDVFQSPEFCQLNFNDNWLNTRLSLKIRQCVDFI